MIIFLSTKMMITEEEEIVFAALSDAIEPIWKHDDIMEDILSISTVKYR